MSVESIGTALGGKRSGHTWIALCPAHDDHKPSLSIRQRNGKVLVRCHAGCTQSDVIEALRQLGLWPGTGQGSLRDHTRTWKQAPDDSAERDDTRRTEFALRIWDEATAATTSIVQAYLSGRGITCDLPGSIRFHRGLKHSSGGFWPAMVALVSRGSDGQPLAIHRTFLQRSGSGKAPVDPAKMMLGPCRGGVVRLGNVKQKLLVGEGLETCLSAMQVSGVPAWAALSTSGLRTLKLPVTIVDVVIVADGDDAGERAAQQAAARWQRPGRRVRIARPPRGRDFNDILMETMVARVEGRL